MLLQVGERLGWFIGVDLDVGSSCRTRNRPLGRRRRRKRFYKECQSEEEAMNSSTSSENP
jgi:hypothetical protein